MTFGRITSELNLLRAVALFKGVASSIKVSSVSAWRRMFSITSTSFYRTRGLMVSDISFDATSVRRVLEKEVTHAVSTAVNGSGGGTGDDAVPQRPSTCGEGVSRHNADRVRGCHSLARHPARQSGVGAGGVGLASRSRWARDRKSRMGRSSRSGRRNGSRSRGARAAGVRAAGTLAAVVSLITGGSAANGVSSSSAATCVHQSIDPTVAG